MNVVPHKKFDYDTWLRVAAQNNAARTRSGLTLWAGEEAWQLWRDFFSETK